LPDVSTVFDAGVCMMFLQGPDSKLSPQALRPCKVSE
jgi:hypothetical protein